MSHFTQLEIHPKFKVVIRCTAEEAHYESTHLGDHAPIFKRELVNVSATLLRTC